MRDGERSPHLHFLPCQRFLLKVFGTTNRGKLSWSSHSSETCRVVGTSSEKKKRGRDTSGSARCGMCAWWWWRSTFPKSLREWPKKKDRRFKGVWCTWDPAVRTSGALAFAAQVFDTKELVSQDHSAPPTPQRLCGKRRFRFK